ncbi:MAG TPA: hypothetical protein VGJ05_08010 [Fimbriiglobus sp.]
MNESKDTERMDVWADAGSVQIIAITNFGEPVDCSAEEAREFAKAILASCDKADGSAPGIKADSVDS